MRDVEHRGMGTLVGVKNPYKWEICLSMEKLGVTVWIEIEVVKTWQGKTDGICPVMVLLDRTEGHGGQAGQSAWLR